MSLFATLNEPPTALERDPRFRWRCDKCGRFAGKDRHVVWGYFDNTPSSNDWNPGECLCGVCK